VPKTPPPKPHNTSLAQPPATGADEIQNNHAALTRKRSQRIRSLYRLDSDDYLRLLHKQNGRCAICHRPATTRPLCVDHDHHTGEVRGLLCTTCNSAIGMLQDDPAIVQRAAEYLRAHKQPPRSQPRAQTPSKQHRPQPFST
jgi:Fe-S oxidoreductase